ncbi:major facilitator superfamily domain-containing protein 9-like [Pectinophora gossypiella]|uniref:major facilitator superfamily domain-containing protein 9-like n=1 Tax=Pectinophora gossypiella TaxID=13191 RepID=UPI00214DFD00|nr:major facilitator superfamily domain-containing protein 9-like [Pectinophora gossypiella]
MSFSIHLLHFIAFVDLLAVGLILPLVPAHARQLGASHVAVGLLGSVYATFQLGSGPLVGSLSDVKGRKTILMLSLVVCSVAYGLTGIVTSVTSILCLRALLGLFKQTQMLTRAMVPDYEGCETKQSEIYGKMAAISGAGITIGPVIGGHVLEDYPEHGFKYIALAVGACFLLNAGLVYTLPKTVKRVKRKSREKHGAVSQNVVNFVTLSLRQSVIELYKVNWYKFWDVFMLKALIGFAMGVYYSNYSLYLKTIYLLSPKYVGYVISFQGVIGSLSSFFMGYINRLYCEDNDYSLRNLHVFAIISISLIGMILSSNVYVYAFWLIPLAIGNATGRLVTLEMILRRSHGHHRGTLIGASNSVRSLSGIVAPMVAGLIGQYVGVTYVIYASLLATLIGLGMSYHTRNTKMKND